MIINPESRFLYRPVAVGGFSEPSEEEKSTLNEASWIQLDRELRASRMRVSTIALENTQTTWDTFVTELRTESKAITNPIEHQRLENARLAAEACEKTYSQLQSYLTHDSRRLTKEDAAKLAALFEPRPLSISTYDVSSEKVGSIHGETKVRHGARVARIVTKMGVLDPHTIATAGLHDLAELLKNKPNPNSRKSSLSSVIENKLRTSFKGTNVDVDTLLAFLADFERLDQQGKNVSDNIAERLPQETGLNLGHDFSMRQMIGLENWVHKSSTHKSVISENSDGKTRVSQRPAEDERPRFENLVSTLSRATENTWLRDKDGKKVPIKAPHIGPRIAYLAAAVEHSFFPKQYISTADGQTVLKTREDEQKVALGLWFEHLPVFNALGDPPRRIALEIIQRAFTPNASRQLYEVATKMSEDNGGDYFEACARVYEKYIVKSVDDFLANNGANIVPISDIEWKKRIAIRRLSGDATSPILAPNEIYLRGYVHPPEPLGLTDLDHRVIDVKTASSMQEKMKDIATSRGKVSRLKPQLSPEKFGTAGYFRELLKCQHDGFRTRIVAGDTTLRELSAHMHKTVLDVGFCKTRPDTSSYQMGPDEMVHDGYNYADSVYTLRTEDEILREFAEASPDGSFHFIYSPLAISNMHGIQVSPVPNLELHLISDRTYRKNEIDPSETHRVGYKQRRRIAAEVDGDERGKKLLSAEVARLSNKLAAQYYQLLHEPNLIGVTTRLKQPSYKKAGGRIY